MTARGREARAAALRAVAMAGVALLALQLFFLARVAMMRVVPPESTAFQRTGIWRLLREQHALPWSQQWVDGDRISVSLKRAVIASEDAGFVDHHGIEWDAVEHAWQRNEKAEARADAATARAERAARRARPGSAASRVRVVRAKVVGGSTISQQLAKNLFLSPERTLLRKAQEAVITLMLEFVIGKDRILVTYLNSVEWGDGIYGAQAAARHYYREDAARLTPWQAARLAVMLPAPRRFERTPRSPWLAERTGVIVGRMGDVSLP